MLSRCRWYEDGSVRYELQKRIRGGNAKTRARPMPRTTTLLPGFRKPQESTLYAVSTWTERLEVYGYLVCVKHYVRVRNRLYTRVQLGTCAYKVTRKKVSNSLTVLSTIRDTNSSHNFGMTRFFSLFFPWYRDSDVLRLSTDLKNTESSRVKSKKVTEEWHVTFKERIFFSKDDEKFSSTSSFPSVHIVQDK